MSGPAVVHLIVRIVLGVALIALLVANGVKQAPRISALVAAQQAPASTPATVASPPPSVVTASASATPSDEPVESPSALPPIQVPANGGGGAGSGGGGGSAGGGGGGTTATKAPPALEITGFTVAPRSVVCPSPNADGSTTNPTVTIAWTSSGAATAKFTARAPGRQDDVIPDFQPSDSLGWEFPCPAALQTYTVTVTAKDGRTVSRTATVNATGAGIG